MNNKPANNDPLADHRKGIATLRAKAAHADKLAEAGERLKNAVSDLINEPRTLEIEHYAETALHDWQSTLAACESKAAQ